MHRVTATRSTIRAFRMLHPDAGFWIAHQLLRKLADNTRDRAVLTGGAAQGPVRRAAARAAPDLELGSFSPTPTARRVGRPPSRISSQWLGRDSWCEKLQHVASGPPLGLPTPAVPTRSYVSVKRLFKLRRPHRIIVHRPRPDQSGGVEVDGGEKTSSRSGRRAKQPLCVLSAAPAPPGPARPVARVVRELAGELMRDPEARVGWSIRNARS